MFNDYTTEELDLICKVAFHIKEISSLLGIEVTQSNLDTPHRVAKMYVTELFANRGEKALEKLDAQMTLFDNEGYSDRPIVVKDIPFNSVCEHHWLPFFGKVTVSYIPNDKIIGLSKIPRVVKFFSKKPQLQERFTKEVGEYLVKLLKPKHLWVSVEALHTCVLCRGAESEASTITDYTYQEEDV